VEYPKVNICEYRSFDSVNLYWNAENYTHLPFLDVCVMFAKNQPAPRGNLAVHCGGPGTLSNCVYTIGLKYAGQDNAGTSNLRTRGSIL
jgi:hypothetical protein